MRRYAYIGPAMPRVLRLGLATRGNTNLAPDDVLRALEQGVNYWNWCGHDDGMGRAIGELGSRRSEVVVATQVGVAGWSGDAMRRGIDQALARLNTDWLDVVTLYYVETENEWQQIVAPDGAWRALDDAKRQGLVRSIGLTTHQRPLAARWAQTGKIDLLMIRYNAAHRGAEHDVFPITQRQGLPVVCFTCLRWGALLEPAVGAPDDGRAPEARDLYRFVLSNDSVSVALTAPNGRRQLQHTLSLLDDWHALSAARRSEIEAHGDRVRASAGPFP